MVSERPKEANREAQTTGESTHWRRQDLDLGVRCWLVRGRPERLSLMRRERIEGTMVPVKLRSVRESGLGASTVLVLREVPQPRSWHGKLHRAHSSFRPTIGGSALQNTDYTDAYSGSEGPPARARHPCLPDGRG